MGIAKIEDVARELEKLGFYTDIIPPERLGMWTGAINAFRGNEREPAATIYPPSGGMSKSEHAEDWSWGHQFEHFIDGFAPAVDVAAAVDGTVPVKPQQEE